MKTTLKCTWIILAAVILALPVFAQDRGQSSSSSSSSGGSSSSIASRGSDSGSTSTGSVSASRDYGSSSGTSYSSSTGYSDGGVSSRGGISTGSGGYAPDPQYSSFSSLGYYYQYRDFYFYLMNHYYMNSSYFGRFYRNREPLVTPELLKLTIRQPLKLSLQLLNAVDELEVMLKERESGKAIDKQAIAAKTQEIRDLTKKIRSDESLAFFDQRRDKEVLKANQVENLGLDAVAKLREMATDLNTQLKTMYTETQPSTISVQSLSAPSFDSLTKGIDKLSRAIENSARKI